MKKQINLPISIEDFLAQLSEDDHEKLDAGKEDRHSVIVYFMYYKDDLDPLHELDLKLDKIINEKGVGKYDGHEINMDLSDGCLYMYGPNAAELFKVVKPVLEETDFTKGAVAVLRFGGPGTGAKEIEVEIERYPIHKRK